MKTKFLKVKNWENFQHYKDRSPPWIKLHRDLLRDYNFICLQDASKMQLILIWLLASQMDNKIPADEEFIKNQIGIKGKINLKELIDKGFLVDDSDTLARRKQSAIVETETETETETEIIIGDATPPKTPKTKKGSRIPDDWECSKELGEWAMKEYAMTFSDVREEIFAFIDYWKAKTGKDAVKLDWDATFRNWIRNSSKWKKQGFKNQKSKINNIQQQVKEIEENGW